MSNECCNQNCNQGRACPMNARQQPAPAAGGVHTLDAREIGEPSAKALLAFIRKRNGRATVGEARSEFVKGPVAIFATTLTAIAACGFFALFFFPLLILAPLVAIITPVSCWVASKQWSKLLPADRANQLLVVVQ